MISEPSGMKGIITYAYSNVTSWYSNHLQLLGKRINIGSQFVILMLAYTREFDEVFLSVIFTIECHPECFACSTWPGPFAQRTCTPDLKIYLSMPSTFMLASVSLAQTFLSEFKKYFMFEQLILILFWDKHYYVQLKFVHLIARQLNYRVHQFKQMCKSRNLQKINN